jgi:hypothetical protein
VRKHRLVETPFSLPTVQRATLKQIETTVTRLVAVRECAVSLGLNHTSASHASPGCGGSIDALAASIAFDRVVFLAALTLITNSPDRDDPDSDSRTLGPDHMVLDKACP